jgi:hypothetical protein
VAEGRWFSPTRAIRIAANVSQLATNALITTRSEDSVPEARVQRDYKPDCKPEMTLPMAGRRPPNWVPLSGNEVTVPLVEYSVSVAG